MAAEKAKAAAAAQKRHEATTREEKWNSIEAPTPIEPRVIPFVGNGRLLDLAGCLSALQSLGWFLRPLGLVLPGGDVEHRFTARQETSVLAAARQLLPTVEHEAASLVQWLTTLRRQREASDLSHVVACF